MHVQLCMRDTKCVCVYDATLFFEQVYDATLNMLNGVLINSSRDGEVKGRQILDIQILGTFREYYASG